MVVLLRRTRRIASLVNSGTTTLQTLDYRNDEALPRERLSPVAVQRRSMDEFKRPVADTLPTSELL